jgi:cbb3-type cytochrome oxidase maturation protein
VSIIYVLIPLAIIIVGIAIGVFFWAVKSNQFEDLDRQGYSILFDDDINSESAQKTNDPADSNANEQQAELAKDKKEPKR